MCCVVLCRVVLCCVVCGVELYSVELSCLVLHVMNECMYVRTYICMYACIDIFKNNPGLLN